MLYIAYHQYTVATTIDRAGPWSEITAVVTAAADAGDAAAYVADAAGQSSYGLDIPAGPCH